MKRGFTLVELLAIIIILGIIITIAYPAIKHQIVSSQNASYDRTIKSIEEAARNYGVEHNLGYPETEQTISIDTLVADGKIERDKLIDPRTDETITGCVYYKWDSTNNIYTYRYSGNC